MTPDEEKIIIEQLKTIEGVKRKLLTLVKKPEVHNKYVHDERPSAEFAKEGARIGDFWKPKPQVN